MKKVLRLWPLAIAAIVFSLNIDIVVAPYLSSRMNLWKSSVIASIIGTLELFYWYWFVGWTGIPGFASKYFLKINGNRRIEKWANRWGKMTIFILGAMPEPSMRAAGLVMCRSLAVHEGLILLAIGNIIHIFAVIGIWKLIFRMF